jgi:hypothetical protein
MLNVEKRMTKYLIGVVLGLLIGVVLYFFQPVQWKGQALVRIGQITQSQSQSQSQSSSSIEPLTTVVERLKSRSFVQAVAERGKRNEIVAMLNVEEKAGMTIKPTRNSDSLVITVVGNSSELVRASIEAVVVELISKHDAILNAYKTDIQKELSRLDAEVDILSKHIAIMSDGAMSGSSCKPSEGKGVIAGFSIMTLESQLEYKLNRSSLLREAISSANIRRTSLIEPTSISEQRIFSSLLRPCLFGALLGIFLSALWVRWGR